MCDYADMNLARARYQSQGERRNGCEVRKGEDDGGGPAARSGQHDRPTEEQAKENGKAIMPPILKGQV